MTDFRPSHVDLFEAKALRPHHAFPIGHPQATAVAFLLDDDGAGKISLNTARRKVRNLRRDARSPCSCWMPPTRCAISSPSAG